MKKLLVVLFSAFFCVAAFAAPPRGVPHNNSGTHDGAWWKAKSPLYKEAFIVGYKSGTLHAVGHPTDVNKFGTSEFIEGLNSFYKDFRNTNIHVDDAIPYVEDQMRGTPDDKLAAELQHLRQAAAPSGDE